jgi:hypothetical protein
MIVGGARRTGCPRPVCVKPRSRGHPPFVIIRTLHRLGVRDGHVQALSVGSVALCVSLWIRAKTVDQDERGNAERRAIFVGLWAPTLWGIAVSLREREGRRSAWLRRRL